MNLYLAILVMEGLITPIHDSQDSEIVSRFRISWIWTSFLWISRSVKLWNGVFVVLWSFTTHSSLINPGSNVLDHLSILHFASWKDRALPSFEFLVSEMLICGHVSCPKMEDPPSFGILYTCFSFLFNKCVGSPWSNDGWTPRLDRMPKIYSYLLRATPLWIHIWRSSGILNKIQCSLLLLLFHYHCTVDHADLFHHCSSHQWQAHSQL